MYISFNVIKWHIIRECALDSKEHFYTRIKVKVSDYYLFTFTGLRSKCPGSAGSLTLATCLEEETESEMEKVFSY